jgi:hypothetical protein
LKAFAVVVVVIKVSGLLPGVTSFIAECSLSFNLRKWGPVKNPKDNRIKRILHITQCEEAPEMNTSMKT